MNFTKPEIINEMLAKWECHDKKIVLFEGKKAKLRVDCRKVKYPTEGDSLSIHLEYLDPENKFSLVDFLELDGEVQERIFLQCEKQDGRRKVKGSHWTSLLKKENEDMKKGFQEIKIYLNSSKFSAPGELSGYVNTKDILLRINEIESKLNSYYF